MDDELERALAELETPLPHLLAELASQGAPRRQNERRGQLALLVALRLVRTPEYRDQILFPEDAVAFTKESRLTREGMRRYLCHAVLDAEPSDRELTGAFIFASAALANGRVARHEAFKMLFEIAEEHIAPALLDMAWSVEHSPRAPFITCDCPVAVWRRHHRDRDGVGLASADEVWFPVDRFHLLVIRPRYPENRVVVDQHRSVHVNRHLAAGCYGMTIAAPADLTLLAGLPLQRRRPVLRFESGPGYTDDGHGNLTATGTTVAQMYAPYSDA